MKDTLPATRAGFDWNVWVGVPFKPRGRGPDTYDCWGLIRAVLHDAKGIWFPSLLDSIDSAACLEEKCFLEGWRVILKRNTQEFDIVAIELIGSVDTHLTIVCQGSDDFLHITHGRGSVVERLSSVKYRDRILAVYRYGG